MKDLQGIFEVEEVAAADAAAPAQLRRERIFRAVRRAIVDGRLPPGAWLIERELCEAFGISRTISREVIRMLAAEKLVDSLPHRGIRVAVLSRKRVREIYAIRTELEVILTRDFLAAATDADIAAAREFGEGILAAGQRGDKVGMVETMAAFETFMNRVADNQAAAEILGQLTARINMLRLLAMNEPGQMETGMDGVRAIIAGITARDSDAAERAVRTYVRRSCESVLRHMAPEA